MPITITHATVATGTDAGNGEIRKAQWNANHVVTGVPELFAQSAVAVSVGATTADTTLATITIPGGAMGPNGYVELYTVWTVNNNANQKQATVRVGGVAGTLYFNSNLANFVTSTRFLRVMNVNSQSSQKSFAQDGNAGGLGLAGGALATSSVNTSSNWDLVIRGQKVGSSADTLTLEAYTVNICYAA